MYLTKKIFFDSVSVSDTTVFELVFVCEFPKVFCPSLLLWGWWERISPFEETGKKTFFSFPFEKTSYGYGKLIVEKLESLLTGNVEEGIRVRYRN